MDALFSRDDGEMPRITPTELHSLQSGSSPPTILDVRSRSSYEIQLPGSIRVLPGLMTLALISSLTDDEVEALVEFLLAQK